VKRACFGTPQQPVRYFVPLALALPCRLLPSSAHMSTIGTPPFRVVSRDCLGIEVPEEVLQNARLHHCVGGALWLYRDGDYGQRPYASINCTKATPFQREDVDRYKVPLGYGWVAFVSPSSLSRQQGSKPRRVPGKGLLDPCVICGEDRVTEDAHFPKPDRFGGTATRILN
jgi:hypothetical protein